METLRYVLAWVLSITEDLVHYSQPALVTLEPHWERKARRRRQHREVAGTVAAQLENGELLIVPYLPYDTL